MQARDIAKYYYNFSLCPDELLVSELDGIAWAVAAAESES